MKYRVVIKTGKWELPYWIDKKNLWKYIRYTDVVEIRPVHESSKLGNKIPKEKWGNL